MKWSIRLGSAFGIPVYMHVTFLLLVAWVAFFYYQAEHSAAAAVWGVIFILALFVCVVLHEFGHALTARRYGIATRDVTLLPIGGLARLERMPEDPRQELWVALAGPAVNVGIAIVLWPIVQLTEAVVPVGRLAAAGGPFLERLLVINLFLVVFNMIPAFPMDGGRVLRAFLASRLEYTRATHIAATVGQTIAFVFGFIGLFWNPFLLFIAFFVWIGAAQEASMVQMTTSLGGIPVARAMITGFQSIPSDTTLRQAIELMLATPQKDFPVVDGGRIVGMLRQSSVLHGLTKLGPETPVSEVMETEFRTLDASEMLDTALRRLRECRCNAAPVAFQGRIVGLVTMDNIGEFVSAQSAIDRRRGYRPARPS